MERAILFNTAMVKEILTGNKTQTRRIIKPQPPDGLTWLGWVMDSTDSKNIGCASWEGRQDESLHHAKPPYNIDDILWVRETWCDIEKDFDNKLNFEISQGMKYLYKIDDNGNVNPSVEACVNRWRPSIHMPRKAARIFLKLTNVKVERLHDITELDARAEGCFLPSYKDGVLIGDSATLFKITWNNCYNNWHENPWVWVVEFEKAAGT